MCMCACVHNVFPQTLGKGESRRLTDHPMRNLDELEYKHSDITKNIYNQQWPLGYSQPSFV